MKKKHPHRILFSHSGNSQIKVQLILSNKVVSETLIDKLPNNVKLDKQYELLFENQTLVDFVMKRLDNLQGETMAIQANLAYKNQSNSSMEIN